MTNKCNHFYGWINDYDPLPLYKKNFAEILNNHIQVSLAVWDLCPYWYKKGKKPTKAIQLLDKRRGFTTIFNFCPYCGEKIDLKYLKELVKNETNKP